MLESAKKSPISFLKMTWKKAQNLPLGPRIFSKMFGRLVPYTGSIGPEILELKEGFARIAMNDKRIVRNHLNSVHAMALANLGEAATGLALNFALPKTHRAILRKFEITYLKKARGRLVATCEVGKLEDIENSDTVVYGKIQNAKNEVVADIVATWRVGPNK